MATRKPKPNKNAVAVLFPSSLLQVSEQEVKKVVKTATYDELHTTYTQMSTMFQLVDNEMRSEIIKRLSKTEDGMVQTEVGFIKLRERSKYEFDIAGIENFFKNKKVDISELFKVDYNVVTKNVDALKTMLDKGWIVEEKKVVTSVFADLLVKYKSLQKFVNQSITKYLTGF